MSSDPAFSLRQASGTWLRRIGLVFLWPFSLAVMVLGVAEVADDIQSNFWPSVQGLVTQSASLYSNRKKTIWGISVRYQYRVGGEVYTSDRLRRANARQDDFYFESKASAIAGDLTAGKQVTVYYPPDKPGFGILMPGIQALSVFILGLGVLLSLWAALLSFGKSNPPFS